MTDFVDTGINYTPESYTEEEVWNNIPWFWEAPLDATESVINIPEGWGWWGSTDLVWWSMSLVFSATDSDTVAWGWWSIYLADWTTYTVSSWNTWNMSWVTYIYYDWTTILKTTTSPQTSVGADKILICVAKDQSWWDAQFQAFWTLGNWVFITADNIAANTITANEIASNTITANQMNVSQLSAITADIGTITSWTITGATLQTASSWQRVVINSDNEITFYDSSGNSATLYGNAWAIYTNGLVVFGSSSAVWFSGKMKIPVWTNLY